MKIGISLDPYGKKHGRFGDDKFIKIKDGGFSAVDYSLSVTETEMYSSSLAEVEKLTEAIKEATSKAGLVISQIHGPWRYPPRDNTVEDRCERMEKMKKCLLITKLLGCRYMAVHPIMPYDTNDLVTGMAEETWRLNVEFMRELTAYAEELGVTVCLENMPMLNFSLAKPEMILALVKEINSEHFKICLDTGHVAIFPNLKVGDEVRRLGDCIKILHVHDNLGDKDAHLFPTEGRIDWDDFSSALYEIGFSGVLSLECPPAASLDDEEFLKKSRELFDIAKNIAPKNI